MSLPSLFRLCTKSNSIFNAKAIHARVVVLYGSNRDVQTNNHLLNMYSKFDLIDHAQRLFDEMSERNVVTWTSLISSYSRKGSSEKALDCFRLMVLEPEIAPNDYTYVAALSACADSRALKTGKEIHGRIYRVEEDVGIFVYNSLLRFYGKCGVLKSTRVVFDAMIEPNTVSCVSLMASYVESGESEEALSVFLRCLALGMKINEYLYGSVLGVCAALENLEVGTQVQCLAVKSGVKMDQFVVTGLIYFYAKFSELKQGIRVFKEAQTPGVTAWTALIGGHVKVAKYKEAIDLFREFISTGLKPSEQTFASLMGAFVAENEILLGLQIYCLILKFGFKHFTFVSNSVLDFYAKTGHLDDSCKIFSEMDFRDIVTWNSLIAGFVDLGLCEEAVKLFEDMLVEGFEPNLYTYSSLLNICGQLPAIEWGKQTHSRVMKSRLDSNIVIGSAIVDMYAKCGKLNDAKKVFDVLPNKNLVSWNAMITGYAQHGFGRKALDTYDVMLSNGIKPNDVTFIGVLSACGHEGLIKEALHYFNIMTKQHNISPRDDHLACLVSIFTRKGQPEGAYEFVKSLPYEPGKVVWRCLLSGCTSDKDLELAKFAAQKILSLDPDDMSAHVMLSNIYADASMWNETCEIRDVMKEKALKKESGNSWIHAG